MLKGFMALKQKHGSFARVISIFNVGYNYALIMVIKAFKLSHIHLLKLYEEAHSGYGKNI
jgi:hypothetical protein